ncbi:hypothetical protein BG454_00070 [Roseinatronobacter bogoriensis subsp. barguzinensis]|uniref:Uncharacterized protein n=1 Tax=Roseinatronobacter bogoriensis subsp. barguzinensis TaxID=441209 RepID=A0A2K8K958_9RHOB|nr:hypothetical protein BG454_00070 [Rhodobaca barguzinensis]
MTACMGVADGEWFRQAAQRRAAVRRYAAYSVALMLAKSAQDQIVALVVAKSPCRGDGPAMRGDLRP